MIQSSTVYGQYERIENRESAYEFLRARAEQVYRYQQQMVEEAEEARARRARRQRQGIAETIARSAARTVGTQIGRGIVRGLLGGLLGGGRR